MPMPSNPPFLSNVLGYAADVNVIPGTTPSGSGAFSYQSAFPQITAIPLTAGGVAPMREDFNAVFKLLSQHVHFLQSGSLYPWSGTLDYLPGAHVQGSDGKEYIAQKSTGPNVPGAPAVDPVGDVSGAWLLATLAYGAPIATDKKPGLVQPDGVTTFVTPEGILSAVTLDPSWIGVPRYWRSTNLPDNHCWANGDFVAFEDWPELEQVYNAGGFAGMLMAWNADSETQAANLGKWRPDAANPTGLYTPNLNGQFFRNWGPGASTNAGCWAADTGRGLRGGINTNTGLAQMSTEPLGPFALASDGVAYSGNKISEPDSFIFDAATVWGEHAGAEFAPVHVWQPLCLYLGRPA